jgi:hypothetical protein
LLLYDYFYTYSITNLEQIAIAAVTPMPIDDTVATAFVGDMILDAPRYATTAQAIVCTPPMIADTNVKVFFFIVLLLFRFFRVSYKNQIVRPLIPLVYTML